MKLRRAPHRTVPLPKLHVVTDDRVLERTDWLGVAADVLTAGGEAVALHVRGPGTDGATLYRLAVALLPHARRTGGVLLVNDRVDVAIAADADGAHLAGHSLPIGVARDLLGADRWLGASFHDPAAAGLAGDQGADFVFVGTIFPTPSHPGVEGKGLRGLGQAADRLAPLRVLGIGGIAPAHARDALDVGAYGVAAVRGIWDAADPGGAVRDYMKATSKGSEGP